MTKIVSAVLTGDLVNYSRLEEKERIEYVNYLKEILEKLKEDNISYDIFRGDSFQAVLPSSREALKVALKIRSFILSSTFTGKNIKPDIRIAIGIGTIENFDINNIGSSDGEAFRNSGPELDLMDKKRQRLTIKTKWREANKELRVECALLDAITAKWTKTQSEVIYYTLLGKKQNDIADLLDITQSNVSARLNSANFDAIDRMIKRYNEIIDEELINKILFADDANDFGPTLKCLVHRHPDSSVFHREYGDYLSEKGSHREASVEYSKALERDPDDQSTAINLIESLYHEKEFPQVEEECRKLLKIDKTNVPALFYLGEIYKRKDNYSKAEEYYKKAMKLAEKDDFNPTKGLIDALLLQEKFDEAESYMKQALELNPSECDIVENMYKYLKEKGDDKKANNYVEKAIQTLKDEREDSEDENHLLYKIAYLHNLIAKYPEAEIYLSKIIDNDPYNPDAHRALASIYNQEGQLKKAETEIGITISLEPKHWKNYFIKGHILQKMKRHEEAKKEFETAIKLNPTEYTAYFALGISEYALGDLEKASEQFIKAHEMNPSSPTEEEMLSYLDSGSFNEEEDL